METNQEVTLCPKCGSSGGSRPNHSLPLWMTNGKRVACREPAAMNYSGFFPKKKEN